MLHSVSYTHLDVYKRQPEEFELPSVSLVSYVELNSPFYPRFSKEEMIKYLHYFEMDIDIDLGLSLIHI